MNEGASPMFIFVHLRNNTKHTCICMDIFTIKLNIKFMGPIPVQCEVITCYSYTYAGIIVIKLIAFIKWL